MSSPFTSPRERRLWILAGSWLAVVYASLDFVRTPTEFLRGQNLLRLAVAAILFGSAAAVVLLVVRRRPGWREIATLTVVGLAYLAVVSFATGRHEERIHFLEYGLLGGLLYAALLERRGNLLGTGQPGWLSRFPATMAMLLNAGGGWGDEGIQALLPDRVYELRDVGLNVGAGVLAVISMALLSRARALDAG